MEELLDTFKKWNRMVDLVKSGHVLTVYWDNVTGSMVISESGTKVNTTTESASAIIGKIASVIKATVSKEISI